MQILGALVEVFGDRTMGTGAARILLLSIALGCGALEDRGGVSFWDDDVLVAAGFSVDGNEFELRTLELRENAAVRGEVGRNGEGVPTGSQTCEVTRFVGVESNSWSRVPELDCRPPAAWSDAPSASRVGLAGQLVYRRYAHDQGLLALSPDGDALYLRAATPYGAVPLAVLLRPLDAVPSAASCSGRTAVGFWLGAAALTLEEEWRFLPGQLGSLDALEDLTNEAESVIALETLQADERIPSSRGCPEAYAVHEIWVLPGAGFLELAVIVRYRDGASGSERIRFLAVTGRLERV